MSELTLDYSYTSDDVRLPDVKALPKGPNRVAYCETPRPMVGVKLHSPVASPVFIRALVDAGAVPTVLPEFLMAELGVDRELCAKDIPIRGMDRNKMASYRWDAGVDATIAGTFRLRIAPVWFAGEYVRGRHIEMVLGTLGFFDHFDVTFQFAAGTFTLEPLGDVEVLDSASWMREEQAA